MPKIPLKRFFGRNPDFSPIQNMETPNDIDEEPPKISVSSCHSWPTGLNGSTKPMTLEDADFSDVGGFAEAYFRLIAVAKNIIYRRSGKTAGGATIARMAPDELVDYAMVRYRKSPGVSQENRSVYDQLCAYMDDRAHTIQKSPKQKIRVSFEELIKDQKVPSAEDFPDETSASPSCEIESEEETKANQELIEDIRSAFSRGSIEHRIMDTWLDGITKRSDAIDYLKVKERDYDAATRRMERAAWKAKAAFAQRTKI